MVSLPERPSSDGQAGNPRQGDEYIVGDIFAEAGADKSVITKVFRLGRQDPKWEYSRPIKILTTSYEQKMIVLRGQKRVIEKVPEIMSHGKRVFLRHDWTPQQLEQDKLLRQKLDVVCKNHPSKGFKIRNGEIVEVKGWVPLNAPVMSSLEVATGESEQPIEYNRRLKVFHLWTHSLQI